MPSNTEDAWLDSLSAFHAWLLSIVEGHGSQTDPERQSPPADADLDDWDGAPSGDDWDGGPW